MNNRNFPRNYSQNDIKKLMHQGQKKADYINRILDTDVHINMASECNSPLKEKPDLSLTVIEIIIMKKMKDMKYLKDMIIILIILVIVQEGRTI